MCLTHCSELDYIATVIEIKWTTVHVLSFLIVYVLKELRPNYKVSYPILRVQQSPRMTLIH